MSNIQIYSKYLLFFSKLIGTSVSPRYKTMNAIFVGVVYCVFLVLIYGGVNGLAGSKPPENFFDMVWTGGYVYCSAIYTVLIVKRDKMRDVIESLSNSFYFDEERVLTEKTAIQTREVNVSLFLMKLYIVCTQVVYLLVVYSVTKKDPPLVFRVKFPILGADISGCLFYFVLFVEIISTQFVALIMIYFMFFYVGICNILSGQIEILRAGYRNAYRTAAHRKQGDAAIRDEMKLIFGENIKHHQSLLKFFTDFNSVSGWLITAMYVFEQIAICFTVFFTHQSLKTNDGGLMGNIAMLIVSCSHTALILWAGDRVYTQSKKIQDSVYETLWYNQEKSFKSSVRIVLEFSKRPMLIAAIPIIPANLASIEKILGAAFSYYNLLVALSRD